MASNSTDPALKKPQTIDIQLDNISLLTSDTVEYFTLIFDFSYT